MERDVSKFLKQVVQSLTAGLVWLFINMSAGIFGGWMFFLDRPTLGNYIFYVWLIASFALLLRFYYRTWKEDLSREHDH